MQETQYSPPNISIIISTFNRYANLNRVLQSITEQECNGTFTYETIIVDNNSTDKTKDTVDAFIKTNPRFRYIFESKKGKCNALNTGIHHSQGEIIAFTDDDVIIDKNWLANIFYFAKEYDFDAVGGRVLPTYSHDTPGWIKECSDILSGPIVAHDFGETIKKYDNTMFPFIGANMAIKRKVFEELGDFNPDIGPGKGMMGDDTELFIRIREAGKRIYYNPKILIMHPVEKCRTKLSYIARWSYMAGKYMALQDLKTERNKLIYYGGVPRYLFLQIIKNIGSFAFTIGNGRKFIKSFRNLFISIGMVNGYYRERRLNSNAKKSS